jgi:hypothetical protein
LNEANPVFSISDGAAASILRQKYNLEPRATEDIDLVVQPDGANNAETISAWLYTTHPDVFGKKSLYGVATPMLILT